MSNDEQLLLSNQICFIFYQIDKEITAAYKPYLDELGLTYPQYLVMLVLWESDNITVGHLGDRLTLNSGTLSPLLKRLEKAALVSRVRDRDDERIVKIVLTEEGRRLKKKALTVPSRVASCINLDVEDYGKLKKDMTELLTNIRNHHKC